MIIELTRRIRKPSVDAGTLEYLAAHFMARAQAMNPRRRWLGLSVVLVGHREMTRINEEVLHHEGTTDVITFRYRSAPGEPAGWRGEIVINAEEAMAAGARRPGGPARELALYLAHGCQHLGGADDATPAERAAMARRQNRWLRHPDVQRRLRKLLA